MILVTGATGNVGSAVLDALDPAAVRAGIRSGEDPVEGVENVEFDFFDPATYVPALDGATKMFLVRPPAIADMDATLVPFVEQAVAMGVDHVAFLSLMGAEQNKRVPHRRVEEILLEVGVDHTFIRPGFFMQNFNTAYAEDIRERGEIIIPAGRGRTSFIDTRDIGAVTALTLTEPGHRNTAYTLTGGEALNYFEAAEILSEVLGREITYTKPTPQAYGRIMKERGVNEEYIHVMQTLYITVRLGLSARITDEVEQLLGRAPISFRQYAEDYAHVWQQSEEKSYASQ
ncbi:MAG: SDR family oxidoreductase [Anaerolineae bacterium]